MRDQATISDADVLARIVDGDAAAVATLYDRYAGMLLALALRILRDKTECEDMLHDAFILVGERARHYVPERGSVAAWLVTLVRNLSIDRVRRRDRRGAIARDILAHEPGAGASSVDPEAHAVGAAEGARVRRALAVLPLAQRATLELCFFSGLSYPEIAEKENLPLGTIKSRAARALGALRDALEKETPDARPGFSSARR